MGSRRGNIRELLPLREYGDRADGSGKIGIRVSSTVVGEVRSLFRKKGRRFSLILCFGLVDGFIVSERFLHRIRACEIRYAVSRLS